MMVGFPRSGTTLLENALAAHPRIETFEEVPAFASAVKFAQRHISNAGTLGERHALVARERYYREIQRRARKSGAGFNIDKLPLNSAHIKFIEQLFPERRYIFSIRHPHDVVLSCFKQMFEPNSAMENLRTIEDACRLYDFVMTQWFDVFELKNTERVQYVRYDDLVERFEPTLRNVLDYIGAGWSDTVLNFAELSNYRPTRTPSYQKVRSGLSIGVQSSRDAYAFVFQGKETRVLDKWVKHFGYAALAPPGK